MFKYQIDLFEFDLLKLIKNRIILFKIYKL